MLSFSLKYETNWIMSVSLSIPEGTKLMSEWPGQPPTHDLFPAQTTIPRVDLICTSHMYCIYMQYMLCCMYIHTVCHTIYIYILHTYDIHMYIWVNITVECTYNTYSSVRLSWNSKCLSLPLAKIYNIKERRSIFQDTEKGTRHESLTVDCYNKEEFRLTMIIC